MADSWIIIADSARLRAFTADFPSRECDEFAGLVHGDSRMPGRELKSDREGRSLERQTGGRHGISSHQSPHQHEAEMFSRQIARWLLERLNAGEFDRFHLAAPPTFLGILRASMDEQLRSRLDIVIDKNLVHETTEAIAERFFGPRKRNKSRA